MTMFRTLAALALISAVPVFASGEYDAFHIGLRGGVALSPDKSFGGLGKTDHNPSTLDGGMAIAPSIGLHAHYSVVPGKYSIGALVDYLQPIRSGSDPVNEEADHIEQKITRGEVRFGRALRSNVDESPIFWVSPTYNWISTSHPTLGHLKENKLGAGLGVTGMKFRERCLTYWEAGLYYLPGTSKGTTAGHLSLELRGGFLF